MRASGLRWSSLVILLVGSVAETAYLKAAFPEKPGLEEGPSIYETWLAQDVKWIITNEERAAFNSLRRDEERQNFVEHFWSERDPTPDTLRNEFEDSHYARMLIARQKFSTSSVAGWNTAQGRIYVMYGQPDNVETKAGTPAISQQSAVLGAACNAGNRIPVDSYAVWHYNKIRGIDHPVSIAFAELCPTGESVAVVDKIDGDWLSLPPIPKYKLLCNGKVDPNDKSYRLQAFVCVENPPHLQFKDLEEIVVAHVRYNLVPYDVHLDFAKITDITDMLQLTITVKNSDVTCRGDQAIHRVPVRIFGLFTTLSHRIVQTVEGTMDEAASNCSNGSRKYTQEIPLQLGSYRLNLALQDVNGDRVGTYAENIVVPELKQ